MSDTRNKAAEAQRRERLAITATPDPWREKAKRIASHLDWLGRGGDAVDQEIIVKCHPDLATIMRELGFDGYGK